MYRIIGADHKEYGPSTVEELGQWIAQGRLNAQSLVRPENSTQWQPLASVPELAALLPPEALAPGGPAPFGLPDRSRLTDDQALRTVKGPAIGLMVVAVFDVVFYVGLLAIFWSFRDSLKFPPTGDPEADRRLAELMQMSAQGLLGVWGMVRGVLYLATSIVTFIAGWKMKSLESYVLALVGAACAILPFCSPCCCLSLPVGIWALVVLLKADVKSSFH